ncbi:MAG: VWA domain-containing protein [Lysobacter spongiicola]|nr:VWA domain-containing protein [Lysobacter spongiicola]
MSAFELPFQFMRPEWLWALLALPVLAWWLFRRERRDDPWRDAVDPHLLAHLVDRGRSRGMAFALGGALAYLVAVVALAGPGWRQVEQPLRQDAVPLVVALDLSSHVLAGDLPPSRLAHARAKLAALLEHRQGGQVGLVAWAGEAFTVAPLTADPANVAVFLDALHPAIMPVDGQRPDLAIEWAVRLLRQAGFDRGQVLLVTNDADARAVEAARQAAADGFEVSVLGLGAEAGAMHVRPDGSQTTTRLEAGRLRDVAAAGNGDFAPLVADMSDLEALGVLDPETSGVAAKPQDGAGAGLAWQDEGYWLLFPLMALVLFGFRRGAAVGILLLVPWFPAAELHAAELWKRPDQVQHQRMAEAAEAYRAEEYDRAIGLYDQVEGPVADYNRGNALARAGDYAAAIAAYDEALRQRPGMEDAIANRQAVEAAMRKQESEASEDGQGEGGPGESGQPGPPDAGQQEGESGDPDSAGQREQGSADAEGDPSGEGGDQQPPEARPPAGDEQEPAEDAGNGSGSTPADPQEQQKADEAQRQRMQQALQNARADGQSETEETAQAVPSNETPEQRERRLANEAWLRRVPDDPGGLLREKFRIEYERRRMGGGWEE